MRLCKGDRTGNAGFILATLSLYSMVACSRSGTGTTRPIDGVRQSVQTSSASYAAICLASANPNATPEPGLQVETYRAQDAGKPGVPRLTTKESATLRRVMRDVHSGTLRIAWIHAGRRFIVYDATDGPCEGGYQVLNGWCSEVYRPGEDPNDILTIPAEIFCNRPRPQLGHHPR